ncbi:MAG: hypothetical protein IT381_19740 [Deltaproteobacteria bacterium]|nr:hypothetical protein [Deltaproteobacteria bacterium]
MTQAKVKQELEQRIALAKSGKDVLTALRLGKNDAARFLRFGHARLAAEDFDGAEAAGRIATTIAPDTAAGWQLLGVAQARARRSSAAIASFAKVTALAPDSVASWLHLAEAQLSVLDFKAAAASLEQAIKRDPKASTPEGLRAQMLVVEILSAHSGD